MDRCLQNGKTLHIMGICSPGNVHGSDEHMHALIKMAADKGIKKLKMHPILDGRDTIYNTGVEFVTQLQAKLAEAGVGEIATLAGRYWTMDRDNRWDRIEKGYNAMVLGKAERTHTDPVKAIEESYASKVYDEEFEPTVIVDGSGQPVGKVEAGDTMIFSNFRPDRARQIAQAFVIPGFSKFERHYVEDLYFASMMEYEKGTPVQVAFPPQKIATCLAKVVSEAGLKQLHIAETEKYAHVTFFLNGMLEDAYPNEDRVIIPSPRVSSYDQEPAMSTPKIADRIIEEIEAKKYDFIVTNFANADMVGHTGSYEGTKAGCEAIDKALERIVKPLLAAGGAMVITADHGNGEEVLNLQTGEIDKEHSTNPVPFLVIGEPWRGQASPSGEVIGGDLSILPPVGMLADTAPTVLKLLGVEQPSDMTGTPLV
jgi:2,3-bisphosphoglycerate-independent phosphoglycerate mutase